jgi:predicted RNA-binding Zn-ribbon protein involved in translation (DUF1610 family)
LKQFIKEYKIEIIAALIGLFGLFLLVERLNLRDAIVAMLRATGATIAKLGQWIMDGIVQYFYNISVSDMLGWLLVMLALAFAVWRIRYRFVQSDRFSADSCPNCGADLHRVHRTSLDRSLSKTLLPEARRYRCTNPDCGWQGLRQRRTSEPQRHRAHSE